MKCLSMVLLLVLATGRASAMCTQFTFCGDVFDYYVPENLMRLADEADEARRAQFWQKLRCWNTSDEEFGRVTCDVGGKKVTWEDRRQDFFKADSALIMVPVDGVSHFGNLDLVTH